MAETGWAAHIEFLSVPQWLGEVVCIMVSYFCVYLYALQLHICSFLLTAPTDSTFVSNMDSTPLSHPPSDIEAQMRNANFSIPAIINTLHADQALHTDTENENMTPVPRTEHRHPNAVGPTTPARKRARVADHADIAIDVVAQRPGIAFSKETMAMLSHVPKSEWEMEIVDHGSEHTDTLMPELGPAGGDDEAATDLASINQLPDSTYVFMWKRACELEHAAEVTQEVRAPAAGPDDVPEVGIPRVPVHETRRSAALCRVPEKLLQEFAFFKMRRAPSHMRAFNKAFEQGIGLSHVPGRGAFRQLQPVAIGGNQNAQCTETLGRQKDTLKDKSPRHARVAVEAESMDNATESASAAATAAAAAVVFDRPRPVCDKQPAQCMSIDGTPRDYVARLLAELAQDPKKPMKLQEKQLEALAAVVSQLENMLAADQNGRDVKQEVLLLMGPAGSGKS